MRTTIHTRTFPRALRAWLVGFCALAWLAGCGTEFSPQGRTVRVRRGDIDVRVRASGALKARHSTRIRSEVQMEAKIIFLAEEGSRVKAGDVLVELDPTELERRIEDMKLNLDQALVHLDASKTELSIQETDGKNQVARAELTLTQAEQEREKYDQGDALNQKRKFEITLEEAESNLERLEEKFKHMPELEEEGFVTALEVKEEEIKLKKARVGRETARRELDLFNKYTLPMERARKKSAVEQAKGDLDAVKKRTTSKLKQRRATKLAHENRVKKLRQEISDLEEKLGKMKIKAPTDGLVIYGESGGGRRGRGGEEIKVGSRVWPRMTIITLPNLSEMLVSFRVHEADINKIRKGMEGKVVVESFGGKTFQGTITRIANLANAGGWRSDPDVKMFDVELLLEGKNLGLKPGLTARVEIVVAQKESVLRIPVSAIHGKPGEFHCFVERKDVFEKQVVELGLTSESFAEVLSGLSGEETILLGEAPPAWAAEDEGK